MKIESLTKQEITEALIVASVYMPLISDLTEDSYDDYQRSHILKEHNFVSNLLSQLGINVDERTDDLKALVGAICPLKLECLSKAELFKGLMISSTYLPHQEDINHFNFDFDELPRIESEFNIVVSALNKADVTIDDALEEFSIVYPPSDNTPWRKLLCSQN